MWWNDSTSLACPRCNRRSGVVVEWLPPKAATGRPTAGIARVV